MRKKLLISLAVLSASALSAQQALFVNGGQFGNPANNVNFVSFDIQSNTYTTIDTIQTQSVQSLLVDGTTAYVAAQDSIVSYNLTTNTRIAAAAFNGPSTKALAVYGTNLLVGNFYGKTTDNLYVYDKATLALLDSISQITKAVSNMLVMGDSLYIAQNFSSSAFTDSAGYLSVVDLTTMSYVRDIVINNNGEGLGYLVPNSTQNGFYGINTNSIVAYNIASGTITATPSTYRLSASANKSSIKGDTLMLQVNDNIGSLSLATGLLIDTNIVSYAPTAFSFDTLNRTIYATSTDFFSYKEGKVFDLNGIELDTLMVGFSPEVVQLYYGNITQLVEKKKNQLSFQLHPNPANASDLVNLSGLSTNSTEDVLVTITDIAGKTVSRENYSDSSMFSLPTANLNSGLYLVTVQSNNIIGVKKLIIE
jgi:hypothetical protein